MIKFSLFSSPNEKVFVLIISQKRCRIFLSKLIIAFHQIKPGHQRKSSLKIGLSILLKVSHRMWWSLHLLQFCSIINGLHCILQSNTLTISTVTLSFWKSMDCLLCTKAWDKRILEHYGLSMSFHVFIKPYHTSSSHRWPTKTKLCLKPAHFSFCISLVSKMCNEITFSRSS